MEARPQATLRVACVALAVLSACGAHAAHVLGPTTTVTAGATSAIGELTDFGFVVVVEHATSVELSRAELVGKPPGMELVRLAAVKPVGEGTAQVGVLRGDLATVRPGQYQIAPIKGVVLKPKEYDWAILVVVRGQSVGEYQTKGVRLSFLLDGKEKTETLPLRIRLKIGTQPPDPSST